MRFHRRGCEETSSTLGMAVAYALPYTWRPGLTNVDAELEEFSMNPGSAPQRVGDAHGADQLPDFERHLWSAAARSRRPSPEHAKTSAMPTDNGLRLNDHQSIHNARHNAIETGKKGQDESEPLRRLSSQHSELVRSVRISASSETRDRNSPMTAHQINLSTSPIGEASPNSRQYASGRVYGRDNYNAVPRFHHQFIQLNFFSQQINEQSQTFVGNKKAHRMVTLHVNAMRPQSSACSGGSPAAREAGYRVRPDAATGACDSGQRAMTAAPAGRS